MSLALIVYILTLLSVVVVVLTRLRLRKERAAGQVQVNTGILNVHTFCGVLAIIFWTVFLVGQHMGSSLGSDFIGLVGLAFYWVAALAGIALLARWLPSSGRHAQASTDDDWSEGPGLSVVAHVGLLIGVIIFTYAFAAGDTTTSSSAAAILHIVR